MTAVSQISEKSPAPALAPPPQRRPQVLAFLEKYALLVLFLALCVFFSLYSSTSGTFATGANIRNILGNEAVIAVAALASIVPLTCGQFDLSVGAVIGLSSIVTASVAATHGQPVPVAVLCGVLTGALVGLLNGWLVAYRGVNPLIATLGSSTLVAGLVSYYTDDQVISLGIPKSLTDLGSGQWLGVPRTVYALAVIALAVYYVLRHTPYGRYLASVGSSPSSARLVGLRVDRLILSSFVVSGALSGVAGALLLARAGTANPQVGSGFTLAALSAAFLRATAIRPGSVNGTALLVAVALSTTIARRRAGRLKTRSVMSQIQTVRGPIDTADLGRTYMHEHIFVLDPEVQQNYPQEWGDEDTRVADAVERLTALAASGAGTIVDPTVIGLGRYIPRIARINELVPDLNIVVATGCYTYDEVPFYFHYRGPALNEIAGMEVPDPMVDMFITDITEGIAGTGVKAGMLKCAINDLGMTKGVERVMRAVAKAHLATGVPITVHTHPGTEQGLEAHRVFAEEGVDPSAIVLGHSGDTTDTDHLSKLAEAGFLLGMDRFGINLETTFEARADTVVEMCRRGYAESMVLSHDASCYIDWLAPGVMDLLPQWHYLHIEQEVLPYLREHGVTDDQIDTMLVGNPRRFFEQA